MTNRYTSFEATVAAFDVDTFTFTGNRHDLDVMSEDIKPDKGHIYPATSTGRTRRGRIRGPLSWAGTIESPVFPIEATSLLYYSLGSLTTVIDMPVATINTHTLNHAVTIPDFICEIGRDDKAHRYTGCIAKGVTLDYAPDAVLSQSVDVFFRKEQTTGSSLATITFPDYDVANRAFGGVEVVPGLGAALGSTSPVTFMESASVTWSNEFSDDAFSLGSQYLPANIVADFTVTGSWDMRFTLITDAYNDVYNAVNKSFQLAGTYGATTAQRDVKFIMDNISYDTTTLPTDGNKRYVQTVEFTGENNAAGLPMKIDVINAKTNALMIG